MTNYDVIEAYVEDFTYWTLDNTGITSTPKKIVIPTGTELKYAIAFRGFNSFAAGFDIKYTGNAVITYRYNKEDGTVGTIAIDKSGIYHLPASVRVQKNFGFYCNPQTVTEEATIEQLPTSILKDLSGNGNHAYLYGGKGKLNSGMGVYQEDFTVYNYRKSEAILTDISPNKFIINEVIGVNGFLYTGKMTSPTITIQVDGEFNGTNIRYLYGNNGIKFVIITEPGTYNLPASDGSTSNNGFFGTEQTGKCNITIEQIPDYPNQLCYDGSMCAVCYGFPILEDYTVMADRTWFDIRSVSCFIGKRNRSGDNLGAFEFEFRANQALSFGRTNSIIFADSGIVYQTKNSYNGIGIESGLLDDTDVLIIGAAQQNINNKPQDVYIGCHGKIIIADRSFTEDEITWLKDNWKKI